LFDTETLVATLRERGVHVGVASSVRVGDWEAARLYPAASSPVLVLTDEQRRLLSVFSG
jgi:hypothetical protein